MCEVEEQQAARVEVQGPERTVIRVESLETQDNVRHEETSQEEADEIGFVPVALSEPRGAFAICPRVVITCFRGSPKKLLDLSHFQV